MFTLFFNATDLVLLFQQNLKSLMSYEDKNTIPCELELDPWWIVGFTDADGSFSITLQDNSFLLEFKLSQKEHSVNVLNNLITYFGCGRVNIENRKNGSMKFAVTRIDDLINIVIPFFDSHPLITSKFLNYKDFREAAFIMKNGGHLSPEGRALILSLKSRMNKERPTEEKRLHCESVKMSRNLTEGWVAGFVDGEGSFYVYLGLNNGYIVFGPSLEIKQSTHDVAILEMIRDYFDSGVVSDIKNDMSVLKIKESVALDKVEKLFIKPNTLLTRKRLDFQDWAKLRLLHKNGVHKIPEGLQEMKEIKAGMNTGRDKS